MNSVVTGPCLNIKLFIYMDIKVSVTNGRPRSPVVFC